VRESAVALNLTETYQLTLPAIFNHRSDVIAASAASVELAVQFAVLTRREILTCIESSDGSACARC
jgi:hypothetical protein